MSQFLQTQGLPISKQPKLSKFHHKLYKSQGGSQINLTQTQLKAQSNKLKEQKDLKDVKDYFRQLNTKISQLTNQIEKIKKITNQLEHQKRKFHRPCQFAFSDNQYNAGFGSFDEKSYAIEKKQNEIQSLISSSLLNMIHYIDDKKSQFCKTKNNCINSTQKQQKDPKNESFGQQSQLIFKTKIPNNSKIYDDVQLEKYIQYSLVLKDSTINQFYQLDQNKFQTIKRSQKQFKQKINQLERQKKSLKQQKENLQQQKAKLKNQISKLQSQKANIQSQKSKLQSQKLKVQQQKKKITQKNGNHRKIIQRTIKLLKQTLEKFNIICPFEQKILLDVQQQQLQNIQNPKDQDRSMVEDFQKMINIYQQNLASIVKIYNQNKLFKQGMQLFTNINGQNGLVNEQKELLVEQIKNIIKFEQKKLQNSQHNNKSQQQNIVRKQQQALVNNNKSGISQIEGFGVMCKQNINISTESLTLIQVKIKDWMVKSLIKRGQQKQQLQQQSYQSIDPTMINLYLRLRQINLKHASEIEQKQKTIQSHIKTINTNSKTINDKDNEIEKLKRIIQSNNKTIQDNKEQIQNYKQQFNKFIQYSQIFRSRVCNSQSNLNKKKKNNQQSQKDKQHKKSIKKCTSGFQHKQYNQYKNKIKQNQSSRQNDQSQQHEGDQHKKSINQTQLTAASQNISRTSISSQIQCIQKDDESQMEKSTVKQTKKPNNKVFISLKDIQIQKHKSILKLPRQLKRKMHKKMFRFHRLAMQILMLPRKNKKKCQLKLLNSNFKTFSYKKIIEEISNINRILS